MTNPLEIYSARNTLLYKTPINTGGRRRVRLMTEDSITVKFSDRRNIKFPVGTRIGDFYITEVQDPKYNATTSGYDYELKFDAYYWLWANRLLFYAMPGVSNAPKETSFKLTASIEIHAAVITRCLNALGITYDGSPFRVETDPDFSAEAKYISYANMSVLGGIEAIADAYECEWWVEGSAIHFGKCNAIGEYDFTVGQNVVSMTPDNKTTTPNRLVVFGSTRNLPPNYRQTDSSDVVDAIVVKRLMLPEDTPWLQTEPDIPEDEIVEEEVTLDSVYPRTALTVSKVETYESTAEDGTKQTFYRIRYGTSFPFSKDYILPDEELHVEFESGNLDGMDFAVKFNPLGVGEKKDDGSFNSEAQMFEIVVNEDYGRALPDDVLHPEVGDRFSLYGWDSTKMEALGLLAAAEQELLTEGNKLLDECRKDKQTYTCPMMWDWCKAQAEKRESPLLGSTVNLHFIPGDAGRKSRIIGVEHDLDIEYSNVTYICGEKVSVSRLKTLESKVEGLTRTGDKVKIQNSLDFLSKRYSDRTPYSLAVGGELVAEGGVRSRDFAEGMTGFGFRITPDGRIDARSLILREFLEVPWLQFNRAEVICGTQWRAPGGGVIESVSPLTSDTGKCILKLEEGEFGAVAVGDLCLGIFHMTEAADNAVETTDDRKGNFTYSGFASIYFEITAVDPGLSGFTYRLRDGYTLHPQPAMNFVGYGNRTDETRQKCWYATRSYDRYLSGVSDWEFRESNIMMQLGDLSGLTVDGESLAGYSAYLNNVFFSGTLRQLRDRIAQYADNLISGTLGFTTPWQVFGKTSIAGKHQGFTVAHCDNSANASSAESIVQYDYPFKSGETYTLSFWARGAGKLRSFCYSNVYGDLSTTILATSGNHTGMTSGDTYNDYILEEEWRKHHLVFKVNSNNTSTPTHVLFNALNSSDVSIMAVKLETGDNRNASWSPSAEDMMGKTGAVGPQGPAGADGKNGTSYAANLLEGTQMFTGTRWNLYDTMSAGMYRNCRVIENLTAGNMREVAQYSPYSLQNGTDYTLSFWAKGSGTLRTFVYPAVNAKTILPEGAVTSDDTFVEHTLTSEWKRYTVAFRTLASGSLVRKSILFRAAENCSVSLAGVKLEYGVTESPEWVPATSEMVGTTGPAGPSGAVMRIRGLFDASQEYADGTTVDADGVRWIDVVWVESTTGTRYYYTCAKSTGAGLNPPTASADGGNDNWEPMSDLGSVYADMIFARNAHIDFLSGQEIVLGETLSDGTTKIWGRIGVPTKGVYDSVSVLPASGETSESGVMTASSIDIGGTVTPSEPVVTLRFIEGIIMWLGGETVAKSTMSIHKSGTTTFGSYGAGKRIVINPDEKSINVYNDSGKLAITVDGNTHTIDDLFKVNDNLVKAWAGQNYSASSTKELGSISTKSNGHIALKCSVAFSCDGIRLADHMAIEAKKVLRGKAQVRLVLLRDGSEYISSAVSFENNSSFPSTSDVVLTGTATTTKSLQMDSDIAAGNYAVRLEVVVTPDGYGVYTAGASANPKAYTGAFTAQSDPRAMLCANGLFVANSTQNFLTAGVKSAEGFVIEARVGQNGIRIDSGSIKALDSATNTYRKIKLTFE